MEIIPAQQRKDLIKSTDAYLVWLGEEAHKQAPQLAELIRDSGLTVITHCGRGGLKSQFKKADRSGARFALILGDEELSNKTVTVKSLRDDSPQQSIAWPQLATLLQSQILCTSK